MINSQFVPDKPQTTVEQFEVERKEMVETQLRDRKIKDAKVLAAMSKVPRHEFVDSWCQALAYSDRPLPIDHHQTISNTLSLGVIFAASVI